MKAYCATGMEEGCRTSERQRGSVGCIVDIIDRPRTLGEELVMMYYPEPVIISSSAICVSCSSASGLQPSWLKVSARTEKQEGQAPGTGCVSCSVSLLFTARS